MIFSLRFDKYDIVKTCKNNADFLSHFCKFLGFCLTLLSVSEITHKMTDRWCLIITIL